MKLDFQTCILFVLADEGGYVEREIEPGGAGNFGISFTLFSECWKKDKKPGIPTWADLKKMTAQEASNLYEKYVFPLVDFDNMPAGLDYVMVNTATMQGATGARKLLNEQLNLPINSKFSPDTYTAIEKIGALNVAAGVIISQLALKMVRAEVVDYIDKKTGKTVQGFGGGWSKRLKRLWLRALAMAKDVNINKQMKKLNKD